MIRFSFIIIAVLSSTWLMGCASLLHKEQIPEQRIEAAPVLPPKIQRVADFSEVETFLNKGTTKFVKVPRAVLKEWVRIEKQRANECRITEEQLEAIKAIDTERWNNGKSEKADSSHR